MSGSLTTARRTFSSEAMRRRRRAIEMSQEDLGRRIGRTRQAVSYWESKKSTRKPTSTVIPLIAQALGVQVDELYE